MIVFFAVYNLQGTVHHMIVGIEQLVIEIIILIKLTADDCFHLHSYHVLRLGVIREIHRNSCLFCSLAYGLHHIISRLKFLDELINKQYKFKNPSPIQSIVIPLLLKYKNVVASSETGSGKTLSYLIPCIHNSLLRKLKETANKVLIFLPTKELAKQIYNEALIYSKFYSDNEIKVKYVNKGLIESIRKEHINFIKNNDIFIATPKNISNLLEICDKDLIDQTLYIILDEADKFFDYGFAELVSDILAKFKDKPEVSNVREKLFFAVSVFQFQ